MYETVCYGCIALAIAIKTTDAGESKHGITGKIFAGLKAMAS